MTEHASNSLNRFLDAPAAGQGNALNRRLQEAPFDPEGSGFDIETARRFAIERGFDAETGQMHFPTRAPLTPDEAARLGFAPDEEVGLILKGARHPSFQKGIDADAALGFRLVERDGRFFTVKKRNALR